jgi:MarR family transcriptional regulator, lower aerobic nicotinate degradation pathway regulator
MLRAVTSNAHHHVLTPLPGENDLGLVDALAQLSFAVQATLGQVAASFELSIVQARLLGILRDRRPTIKELALFLGLDKSSVTGLVDRAEHRGLVQRVASALDGRSVLVAITPSGQSLIDGAARAFAAQISVLVADLSAYQQSRLSDLASRVVATEAHRRGLDTLNPATHTT